MSIFDALTGATGIGAIGSLIGAGVGLFEGFENKQLYNQLAGVQTNIANTSADVFAQEQKVNEQRRQQMVLNSQRQSLDVLRRTQQAISAGVAKAADQGASFSSALSGGISSAEATSGRNLGQFGQNLQIGQNIFGLESLESTDKMQIALLQGQASTIQGNIAANQGFANLGAGLGSAFGPLGKIFGTGQ